MESASDGADGGNRNVGNAAVEDLREAEARAVNQTPQKEQKKDEEEKDSSTNAREMEEKAGGLYAGAGGGISSVAGKVGGVSRLKKWGPVIAVLALIILVMTVIGQLQSMLPTAVSEMLSEKFNSIDVSTTVASDAWLDTQLNLGVRTNVITDAQSDNTYALSSFQVEQFETHGLEVVDLNGCASILYEKSNTEEEEWYAVTGSECAASVSGLASASGVPVDEANVVLAAALSEAADDKNVTKVVSVDDALKDVDFKYLYAAAAKPWRGGNSGWYDNMMTDVSEEKLGVVRNRWKGYEANSSPVTTEEFKKTAASTIKPKTKDTEMVIKTTVWSDLTDACPADELHSKHLDVVGNVFVVDFNEGKTKIERALSQAQGNSWELVGHYPSDVKQVNGEVLTIVDVGSCICVDRDLAGNCIKWNRTVYASDNGSTTANGSGSGDMQYNASVNSMPDEENIAQVLANRANHTSTIAATKGRSDTCTKVDGVVSAYTVLSAYENVQFINMASGYLEAIDKMKAGEGAESPIHEYAQILTTHADTVMYDDSGTKIVREGKSAMESEGMTWLFSEGEMDANDLSLKNVNVQSALASVTENQTSVYQACGYVDAESNTGNLSQTGMDFIPVLGKSMDVVQKGVEVNIGFTVNAIFNAAMTTTAKRTAKLLLEDAAIDWVGEDYSNALVSGASKYLGGNAVSGGQSPADEKEVIAYLGQREVVLAQEAEYERATRSPFDATSRYTFLGTLAYSLIPMAYSSGGVMSLLTNVASVASSAVTGLLPMANAAVNINGEITSTGNCPVPNGTNIVEDAYCNAYIITDVSTIKTSPLEIKNQVASQVSGNEVGENTDLGRYITYCGQRSSQYNVKDSTIVNNLQDEQPSSTTIWQKLWGFIINILPFLKKTQTVLEDLEADDKLQWATGEACMATENNAYWVDDDHQTYQRWSENMRLIENMNPGYTSPVTKLAKAYIDETTKNDDTLEGVIARFAGMTVDEVGETMDLIAYYLFLDGYDASTLYAFGADPVKVQKMLDMKVGVLGGDIYNIYWAGTEYADTRNRAVSMV